MGRNLALLTFAVCLMLGMKAWADPVVTLNADNDIFFRNAENWVDVNGNGQVDAGDYFYGIINAQDFTVNGSTTWNADNVAPGIDSFSGYFLSSVGGTTFINPGPDLIPGTADDVYKIDLAPKASDPFGVLTAGDLASGVVLKMFADSSTGFETNGTIADDIAKATDGSFWGSFTTIGGYWYTLGTIIPPGSGNKVGDSFGGLQLVSTVTYQPWVQIDDPLEGIMNIPADLIFTSEIEDGPSHLSGSPWQFGSEDPATFHPTPEPTSLLLLGVGLFGLAGAGRMKNRKVT